MIGVLLRIKLFIGGGDDNEEEEGIILAGGFVVAAEVLGTVEIK